MFLCSRGVYVKKIISILFILGLCTSAFARIRTQVDTECLAGKFEYLKCEIPSEVDGFTSDFDLLNSSFSLGLMWEFDTDNTKDLHFYVGGNLGLSDYGFPLCVVGGLNKKLCDLGSLRLEMDASFEIGPCFGLYYDCYFFNQENLDFLLMKENRKGLFGGIGISNYFIPWIRNREGFGKTVNILDTLSAHLVLGVKI